jgi:hypothetical protein
MFKQKPRTGSDIYKNWLDLNHQEQRARSAPDDHEPTETKRGRPPKNRPMAMGKHSSRIVASKVASHEAEPR